MRKVLLITAQLLFSMCLSLFAQIQDNFIGSWNSVCSEAPDGYQNAVYEVKKDTVFITYQDDSFSYTSIWEKMESDTLWFAWDVGVEVVASMYFDDASNLIGKANWNWGGEVEAPLILTRIIVKE